MVRVRPGGRRWDRTRCRCDCGGAGEAGTGLATPYPDVNVMSDWGRSIHSSMGGSGMASAAYMQNKEKIQF
jgi:hypothetical protein